MEYDPEDNNWFPEDDDQNLFDDGEDFYSDGGPSQEDINSAFAEDYTKGYIWVRLYRSSTNSYLDWCLCPVPLDRTSIANRVLYIFPNWEMQEIYTQANKEHQEKDQ